MTSLLTRYWPRRASGLPPGQRLPTEMPRFSDVPQRPAPTMPDEPLLEVSNGGRGLGVVTAADLQALGPRVQRADFHCVTTWSVRGLDWTGVPRRAVFASVGITDAPPRLVSPSQYGYKSVKHLVAIDFRAEKPRVMAKEHLRARVALEERHPRLPGWLVALPYRLVIPPTAYVAERSLRIGREARRP